ncbi:hypothetical protein BMS3Bbin04_01176 [bacterium BMS3Bbin04]|nr:hypothetical protein BMS3Bbin04_01176 [bacterium BMS3Bbin04]
MMEYYSESVTPPQLRNVEEVSEVLWGGVLSYIDGLLDRGAFGKSFPETCDNGSAITCGNDKRRFYTSLQAEIRNIIVPIEEGKIPPTLAFLDFIQFCHRNVSYPIQGNYHSFYTHYHLSFDEDRGRESYSDQINRLFKSNNFAYELHTDGKIVRLITDEIARVINIPLITGDQQLDGLIRAAKEKIYDKDISVRKESLEKLWDCWERLKTISNPDKKKGIEELISNISSDLTVRSDINDEADKLSKIGNKYRIRHHETDKIEIEDTYMIDYLFVRMLSLINLLVAHNISH